MLYIACYIISPKQATEELNVKKKKKIFKVLTNWTFFFKLER